MLGDPEAVLETPKLSVAGEQIKMANLWRVGDDPFQPVPAGGLLDLILVYLRPGFPFDLGDMSEAPSSERLCDQHSGWIWHGFRTREATEYAPAKATKKINKHKSY